jgi:hypothetical protein
VLSDTLQNVLEVNVRVHVVRPTGRQQALHNADVLGVQLSTAEQPVLFTRAGWGELEFVLRREVTSDTPWMGRLRKRKTARWEGAYLGWRELTMGWQKNGDGDRLEAMAKAVGKSQCNDPVKAQLHIIPRSTGRKH